VHPDGRGLPIDFIGISYLFNQNERKCLIHFQVNKNFDTECTYWLRAARREAIIQGYHIRAARLTEPNLQQQHSLYVPSELTTWL
jgi:hypothetical protein